jgi:predicted DNA repair protein MutK
MLSPISAEERAARMSGVLALLDDVAAIAKVAAASVDDVVGQAAKAGGKAAGAVIDDAAVTPKYVHGFAAERELPIVWKIARGSIFNKMVILLPAALILSAFAPWAIAPLLMLGGLYLCFEGAEKVSHWLSSRHDDVAEATARKMAGADSAHLEEKKVRGAVKTDFILSAEIMTIALAAIETDSVLLEALALAVAGIGVTVLVYGSVALIVKADDMGLYLARTGGTEALRGFGRAVVRGMPLFLSGLTVVGTLAMLWVGGAILTHALAGMGAGGPEEVVHTIAHAFAPLGGLLEWLAGAALHGALGLGIGVAAMPVVDRALMPLMARVGIGGDAAH